MGSYGFFDNARAYSASELAELLAVLATSGVAPGWGGQFAASLPGGLAVQLADGLAVVRGRFVKELGAQTLSVAAPHPSLPRWDRVVVRLDLAAATVAVAVKTGVPAAQPSYPPLSQDPAGVWELPLWGVRLPANGPPNALEDQRLFVGATPGDHIHSGPGAGGALPASSIPPLDASKIVTGTFPLARLPQLPDSQLDTTVARPNLLDNPTFAIWQRGSGPFTKHGAVTADRWVMTVPTDSTMSVSQVPEGNGAASGALQWTGTVAAGSYHGIRQDSDPARTQRLRGHTLTFAVLVDLPTGAHAQAWLWALDGTGNALAQAGSSITSGPASQVWLATSLTLPAATVRVRTSLLNYFTLVAPLVVYGAQLVPGTQYGPLVAPPHAQEWLACQRYYQRIHTGIGSPVGVSVPAGTTFGNFVQYQVALGGIPTVTLVAPSGFNYTNLRAPIVEVDALQLVADLVTAGSGYVLFAGGGASYIAVEWNP